MASFRPNIDLLALPGAKALSFNEGTAEAPRNVNYVCIPADLNEIHIAPSRDGKRMTAYLSLMMRPLQQKYIDAVVMNKQRRGDAVDMSKIESHELTLNHTSDFFKVWCEAVAAKVLSEHPDWRGQNPLEKMADGSNDLYYEVRSIINKRIGKAYPMLDQPSQQHQPQSAALGAPPAYAPYLPNDGVGSAPVFAAPMQQGAGGEAAVTDLPF